MLVFCTLLILYCNFSGLGRTLERENGSAIVKYVAKPFSYSCVLSACPRRLDQWGRIEVPEIGPYLCVGVSYVIKSLAKLEIEFSINEAKKTR